MPKAETWLASRDARVERVSLYGFRLAANASLRKLLLADLQHQSPYVLKPGVEERFKVLSSLLIFAEGYKTHDQLAGDIGVRYVRVMVDMICEFGAYEPPEQMFLQI